MLAYVDCQWRNVKRMKWRRKTNAPMVFDHMFFVFNQDAMTFRHFLDVVCCPNTFCFTLHLHPFKKKKIVKWYCQLNVMQWIVRIRVRQNSYFKNWSLLVIEWICWIRHTLHRTQTGNATFLHKTQLIIWLFMPIYSLICTI